MDLTIKRREMTKRGARWLGAIYFAQLV
uniref:Uncharacterized protein n=1 Tax=Arundo donax TaxID=35708 RepID=A0A0A8Z2R3_ARUDO